MSTIRVAVYGTLRKGESRNGVLSKSKFLGEGILPYYLPMFDLGPYPAVVQIVGFNTKSKQTKVEVYEIDEDTLTILDRIEGHPNFYKRKLVKIKRHGRCWVYVLNDKHDGVLIEGGDWCEYRAARSN